MARRRRSAMRRRRPAAGHRYRSAALFVLVRLFPSPDGLVDAAAMESRCGRSRPERSGVAPDFLAGDGRRSAAHPEAREGKALGDRRRVSALCPPRNAARLS